jgi:hypothetical protein
MAHEYPAIDLNAGDVPDIAELAEEVHRTKQPRVIRRADEDIAVLMPAKKAIRRSPTPSDVRAAWEAFGSWKDEDLETFLHHNEESRRRSSSPLVKL